MNKRSRAEDVSLVPFSVFKKAAREALLNTTKRESDEQLAAIQAANTKKRARKKKR